MTRPSELRALAERVAAGKPPDTRECTCHPDERPTPCQHRYAFSECKDAAKKAAYYLAQHTPARQNDGESEHG